jgi:hypothetical protein
MKNKLIALALSSLAFSNFSFAAQQTTQIEVSANLNAVCYVKVDDIKFGNHTITKPNPNRVESSNLRILCSKDVSYTISSNQGLYSDSGKRRMIALGEDRRDYLLYALFLDSGLSNPWGNGTSGNLISGASIGVPRNISVYASIDTTNYFVKADAYKDTITVNVVY